MKRIWAFITALIFISGALAERMAPEIVDESPLQSCTLRFVGDFVIHDNILNSARALGNEPGAQNKYEFFPMLEAVAPYLAGADLTVSNIDGTLGSEELAKKHGYSGYPAFLTPASLLDAVKDCGIDLLSLSNNHALDYWYSGLLDTISAVDAAGLLRVGGYRSQEERDTPLIVPVNGIKIGFFNYTDSLNMQDKRSALDKNALKFGVCFTDYSADYKKEVDRLRAAGADIVIALMHWGIEYRSTPCQSQLNKARQLASAGVDVIIGGHPHNVQRAEWIGDTLCLYSLGNFFSDQRVPGRDCGIIFDVTLEKQEDGSVAVTDYGYSTTYVWRRAKNSGGYEYRVLLSRDYTEFRPSDMSQADYRRMLDSISEIDKIMND